MRVVSAAEAVALVSARPSIGSHVFICIRVSFLYR